MKRVIVKFINTPQEVSILSSNIKEKIILLAAKLSWNNVQNQPRDGYSDSQVSAMSRNQSSQNAMLFREKKAFKI